MTWWKKGKKSAPAQRYLDIKGTAFETKLVALRPSSAPLWPKDMLGMSMPEANAYVNGFTYKGDKPGDDRWKLPDQFFEDGGGDCEDFAIVKYHWARGVVPVQPLSIAVGLHRFDGYFHAVLVIGAPEVAVVCDNLTDAMIPYRVVVDSLDIKYRANHIGVMEGSGL